MDMGWERKEVAHTTPLPPSAYADRLYYDTAVFNTTLLRRLVEDVGAGHVMMGTDHPFELADFTPVQTVEALDLDEAATRAILWDNAAPLLGLPVDVPAAN
jgi:aminocarboxymuconate-semialdehyde decarboxylase